MQNKENYVKLSEAIKQDPIVKLLRKTNNWLVTLLLLLVDEESDCSDCLYFVYPMCLQEQWENHFLIFF